MINEGITPVQESSDLAEALKELNRDSFDNNRMSAIDMRTRLGKGEISGILAIDTLVSMNALPIQCAKLTLQKKRLAISQMGQGRREIVEIVQGERNKEDTGTGKSFFQWMGGLGKSD